jgi:hypothetical protein
MPSIQYYNSIIGTEIKVSGQNVGIGTASPSYKLDVNGSGHFQDNISIGLTALTNDVGLEIYRDKPHIVQRLSDPTGFIINPNWYGNDEIRYANIAHYGPRYEDNYATAFDIGNSGSVFVSYEADIGIGSLSNDSLIFGTYNIERARITPAGYFGIGTDNPTNKLQVENGNVVFNDLGGTYDFRVEGDADPQLLTVKGSAGTDKVGIGCSPSLGKLHIQALYTNNNGHDAIYIDQRNTSSSNGTYNNAGIDLLSRKLVNSGVSDTGQILGADLVATLDGDGSLNNSYGARTWGGIYVNNSGSLTNAWGIQPRVINGGYNGASITNAYGVDILIDGDLYDRIDGDSITIAMGLRIRGIEHATNKWAIYQEGVNDKNYFAGNLGIGTATPSPAGGGTSLHIHDTNYPEIKLTNDNTGITSDDGSVIQVVNSDLRFTNREDGNSISFYAFDSLGTSRQKLILSESLILVNGAKTNTDFQVKGEVDDNLIRTDANTNRVGIGTATPSYKLDVNGSFRADEQITLGSGSLPFPRKPIELLNPTNIAELTINESFTFPTTDGSGNQAIITDGSGNLSWQSVLLDNDLNASMEAGDGITLVYDSGTSILTIGLNPTGVFDNLNINSNAPSSSTDNGTAGDISWDSNYIYVCVATNTWKRSSLSTW